MRPTIRRSSAGLHQRDVFWDVRRAASRREAVGHFRKSATRADGASVHLQTTQIHFASVDGVARGVCRCASRAAMAEML